MWFLNHHIQVRESLILQWVTLDAQIHLLNVSLENHRSKSAFVIQAKKDLVQHNLNSNGRKLTVTKVMLIKKLLAKPEQTTRLKMIAKQFGVSEMQIRRIKTGENWSQVKI